MIQYYKTIENRIRPLEAFERGCWVSAINPTAEEINYLVGDLGVDPDFIKSSLDEEETSRVEVEDNQTLIIVDVPVAEKQEEENTVLYYTMPIGFIILSGCILTVSLSENPILIEFSSGLVKNVETSYKTHFLLTVLLRISYRFIQYLKQIDKVSYLTERQLHKSMRNKELIQLLSLEKSLVYFSTALKSSEVTLEKIFRGRIIKLYEEDQELLEDVLIEVKQAIETCNIYSGILAGTMDAFASIISNNLNIVMKALTSITIVMAIPNMVFSFYGMNVTNLPFPNIITPLALTVCLCGLCAWFLYKKDFF
ncbi:magnesium transporter CorA family protein [Oscillospiraceae bacterium MB08-C2-2]|nr:magnesium transporter CorA family protein [Oscillospiraceae bacterium MB08-C2-2]